MAAIAKTDPLAAKQAKQKKILIVASIMLVILLAIQLPKLMGGSKKSATATPAAQTAATPGTDGAAVTPAAATPAATPTAAAGLTAPTRLTESSGPKPGKEQLASFSLFAPKDPFVQQIKVETPGAPGAAPAAAPGGAVSGGKSAGKSASGGGGVKVAAVPTYATVSVNGDPQALVVKDVFPVDDPMFRLVAVAPKSIKVGIAGGRLTSGKAVKLEMGKKLTLVNTTTGARYTLELLYTGTSPEQTASFTSGNGATAPAGGTATTQPAAATTPTTGP